MSSPAPDGVFVGVPALALLIIRGRASLAIFGNSGRYLLRCDGDLYILLSSVPFSLHRSHLCVLHPFATSALPFHLLLACNHPFVLSSNRRKCSETPRCSLPAFWLCKPPPCRDGLAAPPTSKSRRGTPLHLMVAAAAAALPVAERLSPHGLRLLLGLLPRFITERPPRLPFRPARLHRTAQVCHPMSLRTRTDDWKLCQHRPSRMLKLRLTRLLNRLSSVPSWSLVGTLQRKSGALS